MAELEMVKITKEELHQLIQKIRKSRLIQYSC